MVNAGTVRWLISFLVLFGVCTLGFFSRLFAIIRYESIIHEFDPWFNYRATFKMVNMGFYDFLNWFDETAWFPLGRVVGGTVYPGLMITATSIHSILNQLSFTTNIQDICVFTSPIFSCFTSLATYLLTKEVWNAQAGLIAAIFMSITPGYTQRSVAGSFDNEGIAIFVLQMSFYAWLKASHLGSISWSIFTAMLYLYMTSAWGGYVFIINMIALHTLVLILSNKYNERLYVAYTTVYCLGQLMAMSVPFVGFQPVTTSEHMPALGVFALIQCVAIHQQISISIEPRKRRQLYAVLIIFGAVVGTVIMVTLVSLGYIAPFSGRFYSLWDTQYARIHLPLISSVQEHQPTPWANYFGDLHALPMFALVGLWYIFLDLNSSRIFIIINAITASYFSGVMVRLMLTLTPVICVLAAIAVSVTLERIFEKEDFNDEPSEKINNTQVPTTSVTSASDEQENIDNPLNEEQAEPHTSAVVDIAVTSQSPFITKITGLVALLGFFLHFTVHCTTHTSTYYSSPSIVLSGKKADGSDHLIDDWRSAYYWLRTNTAPDTAIMSWWDYGYQIAGMADRATVIDNNTWNNTHIALVGKALASDEKKGYDIARYLGVDYVLVFFGGTLGYSSDDMSKFLWMVRIAQAEFPNEIKESNYLSPKDGRYRYGPDEISNTMKDCLMYKLSYYRFGEMITQPGKKGFDMARKYEIGHKNIQLKYFEEAFTTESWMLRIYRVKQPHEIDTKYHKTKTSIKKKRSVTLKKSKFVSKSVRKIKGKKSRSHTSFKL